MLELILLTIRLFGRFANFLITKHPKVAVALGLLIVGIHSAHTVMSGGTLSPVHQVEERATNYPD